MKNLLLIITMLVFAVGCKKKENIYYLSDDVKRNFFFKPGSYWIYRDSISGRVDSCYIAVSRLFIADEGRSESTRFKEILMSGFIQKPIDTMIKGEISRQFFFKENIIKINQFDLTYPIPRSPQTLNDYHFLASTEWFSNLIIGSTNYLNLFHINYVSKDTASIFIRNYWINDSVGFIKMREFDDTTNFIWELQRWHVIK
jgi:hypothetical protein